MSWNPPAAFSVSEVVTASKMNQIRESLRHLHGDDGTITLSNSVQLNGNSYQLLFGAIGDVNLYRHDSGTLRTDDALRVGNGLYANGGVISGIEAFVVGQANARFISVAAESITSSTVTLATSIVSGLLGQAFAVGSTTGWTTGGSATFGAAKPGAGSTTLISYAAGAFLLEITSGGVLQARRASGSETWSIQLQAVLR